MGTERDVDDDAEDGICLAADVGGGRSTECAEDDPADTVSCSFFLRLRVERGVEGEHDMSFGG